MDVSEPDATKSGNPLTLFLQLLIVSAPAFLLLCIEIFRRHGDLAPMVALRLTAAQRILSGKTPYIDFFDWSQPITFDLLLIPAAIANAFNRVDHSFTAEVITKVSILVLVLLCVLLTARIFDAASVFASQQEFPLSADERRKFLNELESVAFGFVISITLASWLARFDFGELQHLLVLCMAPWMVFRWLSWRGVKIPARLSLAAGALCGLGVGLDIPFVIVPIGIELTCLLAAKSIAKPENQTAWLALQAALAVCLFRIVLLPNGAFSAFWHWIVPLKLLSYQVRDAFIFSYMSCPHRSDIIYCMCVAFIVAIACSQSSRFYLIIANAMAAGLWLYLLEKQGYTHDLIFVMFCMCATAAIAFTSMAKRLCSGCHQTTVKRLLRCPKAAAPVVASIIFSCTCAFAIAKRYEAPFPDRSDNFVRLFANPTDQLPPDISQGLLHYCNEDSPVTVLCGFAGAAYPVVRNAGRNVDGYLLWGRPITYIQWLKKNNRLENGFKDFASYIQLQLKKSIQEKSAEVIVLEMGEMLPFFQDIGAIKVLEENYEYKGDVSYSSNNHLPREYAGSKGWFLLYKRRPN